MSFNSEFKLRFALLGTLGMRLGGGCELRHRSPLQGVHRRLLGEWLGFCTRPNFSETGQAARRNRHEQSAMHGIVCLVA